MTKRVALLGSTGSIGSSSLEVIRNHPESFQLVAIAAKSNIDLLEKQAREFSPKLIAVYDEEKAIELRRRIRGIPISVGMEGLEEVASLSEVNLVVNAMTGFSGLRPTARAIEEGKDVALACKEVLVAAGEYMMSLVEKHKVQFVPIDSELSSLFQVMKNLPKEEVLKLIITASGGPFRNYCSSQMRDISVEDALKHPTWVMGPKVTIDSSTLMNKGYELIGAHHLFNLPLSKIQILVHPQSIIHGIVETIDGYSQMIATPTSMIFSVQYAMGYPERKRAFIPPLDFSKPLQLELLPPDTKKFPCLDLAFQSAREGGTYPCFMNAANETLVQRFLDKDISWLDIPKKLDKLLSTHQRNSAYSIDDLFAVDKEARCAAKMA